MSGAVPGLTLPQDLSDPTLATVLATHVSYTRLQTMGKSTAALNNPDNNN